MGISFFIFQAAGYTIDVFRGDIHAEKNFIRYALFISFFPQLVAGPIERSQNLLSQLSKPARLDGENIRTGLAYILFGVWQKVLIADNLAVIVEKVYSGFQDCSGMQILLATALFGIEIYCDFSGYTNIAVGSARLLGIRLVQNFHSPYMAASVTGFWRRWHISLTSWFRDYLYIPLGGSRKGTIRKYCNTMLVFLASGAWHGAAWKYIFWGMLNGLFIVLEDIRRRMKKSPEFKGNAGQTEDTASRWIKRAVTFFMVDFSWMFFRAPSFSSALNMIKQGILHPGIRGFLLQNDMDMFGSSHMLIILMTSIAVLLTIDAVRDKGVSLVQAFYRQKEWVRWAVYIYFIFMIILYGAYGEGYEQTEFIYFQF